MYYFVIWISPFYMNNNTVKNMSNIIIVTYNTEKSVQITRQLSESSTYIIKSKILDIDIS